MTLFLDDGDVRLYHCDALEQLRLMPSESVQCIVTSPPFFQLRDYQVAGQIGLEGTLSEWIASLVAVFNEAKRVLRHDATMWLEIGDSFVDKQLAGAPWRLAFALQEAGWFLRSDCIWARLCPNPMPESVTDRPTKSHSYLFLLTKSARYFYDADAIREDATRGYDKPGGGKQHHILHAAGSNGHTGLDAFATTDGGRNARSVQTWPTEPTPFAHFATFPQALVAWCVRAGTSEHGCCSECGAPWRRITEQRDLPKIPSRAGTTRNGMGGRRMMGEAEEGTWRPAATLGWEPSCDHAAPVVPCRVCDPFMGSGTTAIVARRLGRHAIGIELNASYLEISANRLQQLSLFSTEADARPTTANKQEP